MTKFFLFSKSIEKMLQNEGSSVKIGQKLTELHANAQLEKSTASDRWHYSKLN